MHHLQTANTPMATLAFARLVLFALVLRIAVPAGYMPANLGDGWFLALCPDGMPAHVMVAWLGPQHQHHGQHQNLTNDDSHHSPHHMGYDSGPLPTAADLPQYVQCDLGGGLAFEADLHSCGPSIEEPNATAALLAHDCAVRQWRRYHPYLVRAPPSLSLS